MRTLVFLMVLFVAIPIKAQNFASFPDSNAIWVNSYSTLSWGTLPTLRLQHTLKFCLSNEDTIIQSKNYTKLYRCGANNDYFGAIGSDSAQVFFIPKDSLTPLKIYDFNLLPGDTLKDIYCLESYGPSLTGIGFQPISSFQMGYLTVSQVDTIETYQGLRRMLYVGGSGIWVEGIGNNQGLFWDPFGNISGFGIALECMSVGDSTYFESSWPVYPSAMAGACDLSLVTAEAKQVGMELFPNPSKGILKIELPEPGSLQIYNSSGQMLFQDQEAYRLNLDLSDWPQGLYWVKAGSETCPWIKH